MKVTPSNLHQSTADLTSQAGGRSPAAGPCFPASGRGCWTNPGASGGCRRCARRGSLHGLRNGMGSSSVTPTPIAPVSTPVSPSCLPTLAPVTVFHRAGVLSSAPKRKQRVREPPSPAPHPPSPNVEAPGTHAGFPVSAPRLCRHTSGPLMETHSLTALCHLEPG